MWDGTDESTASNLDRSERSLTGTAKLNSRSRRRAPEAASPPIPLSSRRSERRRTPEQTPREAKLSRKAAPERPIAKSREFSTTVRSFRTPPERSRSRTERRRLEVVPPPEARRPQPARKPIVSPPKSRSALAFLYGTRLLILGVGIGVIAGTSLSIWDPANRFGGASQLEKTEQAAPSPSPTTVAQLQLGEEIAPLKTQIQSEIAAQTQLAPGLMIVDADTHAYLDMNGSNALPAASTIKFPILVAFFQAVDQGRIRLDEPLTMRKELIATESGELQDLPIGSQFPAIEVATKMIDISDNTATNMIIDRLGGKDAVNQQFQSWGLTNTTIQNLLPDLQGTNISSPRDMVALLDAVNRGQLVSMRSHERMLDIMRKVANNSLIPQGLGQGAMIAHKTGDIGTMLGDVGIIDLPNGKRYLMAAMVKRPHNDDRAGDVIRQMSKLTFQYFNQLSATPPSPTPGSQGAQPVKSTIAQP
ncbi:MAG: class A beta-lactamase-related serine hydrolase [Plectolyngbya sp. WJT66-NPBG17]|nr:class A beta-lactamase-related serine hydrolase [Plectolyngbya sp. WJT66-NPBG17]